MVETDPFTGMDVYMAPGREKYARAQPARLASRPMGSLPCPFCPGNEQAAGETLAAWGDDRRWEMRAVANAYPIAPGPHNLLVCSPDHGWVFHAAPLEKLGQVDSARRMLTSFTGRASAWVSSWVSFGLEAGASQPHTHLQVLAAPAVPKGPAGEVVSHREHCPLCHDPFTVRMGGWQVHVVEDGAQVIVASDSHGGWDTLTSADAVGSVVRGLVNGFGLVPYNVVWHDTDARLHPHVHVLRRDVLIHGAGVVERWRTRSSDVEDLAARWAALLT